MILAEFWVFWFILVGILVDYGPTLVNCTGLSGINFSQSAKLFDIESYISFLTEVAEIDFLVPIFGFSLYNFNIIPSALSPVYVK